MKHPLLTTLLLSALILLAACGGGGSGQSSAPGKAATKTEAKAAKGGDKWPDNELTKLLPKPDFALQKASYEKFDAREIFSIRFPGATLEQIQAYAEKLQEAGFKKQGENETTNVWRYDCNQNTAGGHCFVILTWFVKMDENPATLRVERVFSK